MSPPTSQKRTRADKPEWEGGLQYHIELKPGDIPPYVLLPGDPGRIDVITSIWEDVKEVSFHRQYRTVKGHYKGVEIAATSTGIGGPAVEIAMIELINIGAHTFIRVGSTGAIQENIKPGDLVISTAAVRLEGASKVYAPTEYPAVASIDVTLALIKAAESLGYRYHVGITASTDSFYVGQERPAINNYLPSWIRGLIDDLRKMRVLNFEMEAATIFTLANIFGARAGAVCAVFANRITNEFVKAGEKEAAEVASEAVKILKEWDDERDRLGKSRYWLPILE
ncbi:MAG: uridine phosphorylase [Candidatus Njordarchaeales archaeon]